MSRPSATPQTSISIRHILRSRRSHALSGPVLLFALVLAAGTARPVVAQETNRADRPQTPRISSTTQQNPRGADIVEPMAVYRLSVRDGVAVDTTYLGIAKIPDPRLGQEGAFVRQDLETGTMIRISDAVILSEAGLRRMVEFDPLTRSDQLLFVAGPHDVVVSRQGVEPVRSRAGQEIVFDLAQLYTAALINPLTGASGGIVDGEPRTALLTMRSTYPGGESVGLSVALVPRSRPAPMQPIRVVHRDTTVFITPSITYVLPPAERPPRIITVVAALETGYGRRFVRTEVPSTRTDPFTTHGWADILYVDGSLRFERPTHRWRARLFGTSSVVASGITPVDHHQVALLSDVRFEYGTNTFIAVQATGRLADKPYQEFNWKSADYAATLAVGPGRRAVDRRGLETRRLDLLVGLRMGENREIAVYEAGIRARGIGPELILSGHLGHIRFGALEFHLSGEAMAYSINGRGARDDGFRERGLRLTGDVTVGQELAGMFVFASFRSTMRREKAWYPRDQFYFQNDGFASPAIGVEMRL